MPKIAVERKNRLALLLGVQYFKWGVGIALFFILLSVVFPLWRLFPDLYGKDIIPLHYNIHYGVDWTGVWWQVFTYPVASIALCVANVALAIFFIKRQPMLARVVLFSTVLLTALLFCSTVFVVLMNIVYG